MSILDKPSPKFVDGNLRHKRILVPEIIRQAPGIVLLGRRIRSFVFTTDVCIIRNINADAVIAVYPFTPQPIITDALIAISEMPILCGVGGGTTRGPRVTQLAQHAEFQGASGVVVNAPTSNDTIRSMKTVLDIPIVVTVVSEETDIDARLAAGVSILNVSGAVRTPEIIVSIRSRYPDVPIIATGGPTDESIQCTIEAGADAVTYTPPTTGELFKGMMQRYREGE